MMIGGLLGEEVPGPSNDDWWTSWRGRAKNELLSKAANTPETF